MKKSMRCFLRMAMILSWVSAEITLLASCDQQENNQCSTSQAALQPIQGNNENVMMKEDSRTDVNDQEEREADYYSTESRVGSTPPSCRHKCEGCNPCNPIQIPTTTDSLPLQYTNYEPEGWKCKCGSSFFNP